MALSPKEMGEAILRNLKKKTGKDIEEWKEVISKNSYPQTKKELTKSLKEAHKIGHFQAQKIAEVYLSINEYSNATTLVENQFPKDQLELFQAIKTYIFSLGGDVKMKPCKTYVPFSRKTQFVAVSSLKNGVLLSIWIKSGEQEGFVNKAFKGSPKLNFQVSLPSLLSFNEIVKNGVYRAYSENT